MTTASARLRARMSERSQATQRTDDRTRRILDSCHRVQSIPDAARAVHRAFCAEARHMSELQQQEQETLSRSSLAPDVLALRHRIEDPVPTAARIKDRHVQHQHRVMPTPARAKPPSRFLLILRMHCDHFLSLACSKLVANSTNTSAQKIDMVIMACPPLTGRTRS